MSDIALLKSLLNPKQPPKKPKHNIQFTTNIKNKYSKTLMTALDSHNEFYNLSTGSSTMKNSSKPKVV